MKELKVLLESSGFENVRTYIQSGNIILEHSKNPEVNISSLIESNFGFKPKVLILSKKEFKLAVLNNPYKEYEGKFVHFYFCKEKPELNLEKLGTVVADTEKYTLIDNIFYIHAPKGVSRSKLIVNIEECLRVNATGRNLNTVNKLNVLLQKTE